MKKSALVVCMAGILLLASATIALGRKAVDTPVTSTIADAMSISSDGQGNYTNGQNGLSSILQSGLGDWVLDTSGSAPRSVILDFTTPVTSTSGGLIPGINPPFPRGAVKPRFLGQCSADNAYSFPAMTTGGSLNCPLIIGFTDGSGNKWRLAMNPNGVNQYTETNWVTVTCTAMDNGACSHWTLRPVNSPAPNVARLTLLSTAHGKEIDQNHGDFYVTFAIDINHP